MTVYHIINKKKQKFHYRKEEKIMGDLAAELQAGLEIKTAFTIPVFGGIAINQSVVTTWFIIPR